MADQGNEGLLSPYLRAKRLQAVQPFLRGRVLDVGCGSGALAGLMEPGMYLGVELDDASLQLARNGYPHHAFIEALPDVSRRFDTIVSLAVIEHVDDPVDFLQSLTHYLDDLPSARLVITTPHPAVDWVHDLGAALRLFSRHANKEHKELLDRKRLIAIGDKAGLELSFYSRFLFGANQIAAYSRKSRCV